MRPAKAPSRIPIPGEFVRWHEIRSALIRCNSEHKDCWDHRAVVPPPPPGFTLIDVRRRRLLVTDRWFPFVALSYVWGPKGNMDPKRLRAEKAIMKILDQDGSNSASEIPRTIEDAIQVCKMLDERYLWVDRLCIVQDSFQHTESQVSAMDKIYRSAHLVLVVTEGNMDSGIPGIQRKRPQPGRVRIAGQRLAPGRLNLDEVAGQSLWVTRAWTYQEAVLAKRKLFFTPSRVYFECVRGYSWECEMSKSVFPVTNLDPFWSTLYERESEIKVFHGIWQWDWGYHLSQYTRRTLTNYSDIYNAFMGISHAIYGDGDTMFFGLPRADFDLALLWYCHSTSLHTNRPTMRSPETPFLLPSWSWASVKAEIASPSSFPAMFGETLVGWFRVSDVTTRKLAFSRDWKDKQSNGPMTVHPWYPWSRHQFYLAIAWSQGCIDLPWQFDSLESEYFASLQDKVESQWPSFSDRLALWLFSREDWQVDLNIETSLDRIDPAVLIGRAQTAFFGLLENEHHESKHGVPAEHDLLEIIDEAGYCVGFLMRGEPMVETDILHRLSAKTSFEFLALSVGALEFKRKILDCLFHPNPHRAQPAYTSNDDHQPSADSTCDSSDIVTGRACIIDAVPPSVGGKKAFKQTRSLDLTFFDKAGEPLDPALVVNVMLIGHRGNFAHRISIGWVLLTKWAKAKREFKTIFLE